MKKIFVLILCFTVFATAALCDGNTDDGSFFGEDYRDTTNSLKHFSDKDFDNAIEQYKNKFKKPKKVRQKDIKTPTSSYDAKDYNSEFKELMGIVNHTCSVMIPVKVSTENGETLEPGYYSLSTKTFPDKTIKLILSQAGKISASIPAQNAPEYDAETINYCNSVGHSDYVELMYGNIDLSLKGILYIAK